MMGKEFERFKRKFLLDAIVKSSLVFITVALLVIAAFLIVIDESLFELDTVYVILIGVASGLLLGIGTFFIFHLSEKRLAKRLDKIFGLNEKVQTMYAFRNEEGSIKELQRADTQAILGCRTLKWSKLIFGWIAFFVAFLLSLSLFVYSTVVFSMEDVSEANGNGENQNQTGPSTPPQDETFEPTEHHRLALLELIEYVKNSQLQEDAKNSVVAELELLISKLDTFGSEKTMKTYVLGVIERVRSTVNAVNTTYAFNQAAEKNSNKYLIRLNQAMFSLNVDNVRTALIKLSESLAKDYTAYREYINADPEDESVVKSENEVGLFVDALDYALEASGLGLNSDIYVILSELSTRLGEIREHTIAPKRATQKIETAILTYAAEGLKLIIPAERNNENVKVEVVKRLASIFGLQVEDEKSREYSDETQASDPEDKEEIGTDGGFGTGEMIFGSNDLVIDPEKEPGNNIDSIKVEYGEIIARYDAEITRMIENGEISEELGQMLREYFVVLMTPKENSK